jgi:hypothetical protein
MMAAVRKLALPCGIIWCYSNAWLGVEGLVRYKRLQGASLIERLLGSTPAIERTIWPIGCLRLITPYRRPNQSIL